MDLWDSLEKEIESHKRTQEEWMQSCLGEVLGIDSANVST